MGGGRFKWTPELETEMLRLRSLPHMTWEVIGQTIGIPPSSCYYHYRVIRDNDNEALQERLFEERVASTKKVKKHPCLMCRKVMLDGWSYCNNCRESLHSKDYTFDD